MAEQKQIAFNPFEKTSLDRFYDDEVRPRTRYFREKLDGPLTGFRPFAAMEQQNGQLAFSAGCADVMIESYLQGGTVFFGFAANPVQGLRDLTSMLERGVDMLSYLPANLKLGAIALRDALQASKTIWQGLSDYQKGALIITLTLMAGYGAFKGGEKLLQLARQVKEGKLRTPSEIISALKGSNQTTPDFKRVIINNLKQQQLWDHMVSNLLSDISGDINALAIFSRNAKIALNASKPKQAQKLFLDSIAALTKQLEENPSVMIYADYAELCQAARMVDVRVVRSHLTPTQSFLDEWAKRYPGQPLIWFKEGRAGPYKIDYPQIFNSASHAK